MHVISGMVGHGFYNRHSAPQWAAIDRALPWLERALQSSDVADSPDTIALADFGCSEGKNSIAVMQRLLPILRRRTGRPLLTIHSDLATNDFSELFKNLERDARSVFGLDNVFSSAVSGSMFDQRIPTSSVHVAMTFNAIGYLSRRPLDRLPGFILPNGPDPTRNVGSVSRDERDLFARQSETDLKAFLKARAAELVRGGKLLVQVFGADAEQHTGVGLYDALNDAVLELCATRKISKDEYDRYYQPIYFRSIDEIVKPVSELRDLYRLEQAETYDSAVPFVEEYRSSGDGAAYAQAFTNFFRAFTEPVFRMAFEHRSDIHALVADLFHRAERLIRDDPRSYPFRYICVAALMTRL
jgi:cyclopropane-fatty-acyl-phospholipid synthase